MAIAVILYNRESSTSHYNDDQSTIEGTIRLHLDNWFGEDNGKPIIYDRMYFYNQHRDEIRKTIEVVEKDSIPGKDFYLYSIVTLLEQMSPTRLRI